jgi:hypothetical protein
MARRGGGDRGQSRLVFLSAYWRVREAHPGTGQPFYPEPQSRKGYSVPPKGLRFVVGTQELMLPARFGAGLAAENGDGLHGGGALVVVGVRESRTHGEGGQKADRLTTDGGTIRGLG